jgi:hypothetical protein
MTTWLSTSNASDRARRVLGGNRVVPCAAIAVLLAIALFQVEWPGIPLFSSMRCGLDRPIETRRASALPIAGQ